MSNRSEPEVGDVIEVIVASGVPVTAWTVLGHSNRLVLKLLPSGLIARAVRIGDSARFVKEFAVASHVAAQNGPVAPPVPGTSVLFSASVAVSLWEPVGVTAQNCDSKACDAYLALRRCLDSFTGYLPDFRENISHAANLLNTVELLHLSDGDSALLRSFFTRSFSQLSRFQWIDHVLHGDPHTGNVASTQQGERWLDFESACTGPVEWDLSALPDCARALAHDPALLIHLTRLRSACVAAWCASKVHPNITDADAIAYHMETIRTEALA